MHLIITWPCGKYTHLRIIRVFTDEIYATYYAKLYLLYRNIIIMPQCARRSLGRDRRGVRIIIIFENTTSSGTIESSRCYATKLNEANNVYFAVNRKSLNAFVCLRMRTKEATDIILGWIRSRKIYYLVN